MLASIDPYILAFSAVTVIVTIWMGFRSAKTSKTASDFFVAGRSVSVGWNASAISGEYLSAASFMGIAGMVMSSGYDALWYPVCYACGYLFLLLFIAGPLRRFGAYTIPDFAEGRFDSPLFRKIAVVFVLFIGFFYTMPQMKGAGTTLAYIFPGLPYWAGVVLVGAVITLNVALGGMKGITLVQAFQYWAKMFAISVPIFVLMAVYGHYGKQLGATAVAKASRLDSPSFWLQSTNVHETDFEGAPTKPTKDSVIFPFIRYGSKNIPLDEVLFAYRLGSLKQIFLATNVDAKLTLSVPKSLNPTLEDLEVLISNGGLKLLNDGIVARVIRKEDAEEVATWITLKSQAGSLETVRKPLPEKAPADSTWLSPFGPLTTKAAKAAEAKIRSESTEELFQVMNYSVTGTSDTKTLGLAKAKVTDWMERHLIYPVPSIGEQYLAGILVEFAKTRRVPVLLATSLAKNGGAWMTNKVNISTTGSARASEIDAGFSNSSSGLILTSEATIVVPLSRKLEFQRLYDTKGIAPFQNGPLNEQVLKTRQKNYSLLYTYSLIIALVCGTAGLPHILVRFYTNPDGVAAKRTTMWVMILIGIFYVFPPVFGVMGRNLMPELYSGVGAKGTDKIVLELPRILNESGSAPASGAVARALAGSSGHAATSNASGESARSTAADGASAATREGARAPGKIPWGSILSGITCAGAFAAFMSTFSGLLVSMTGALAHDVYGRMFRPKATPEQRLRMFKIAAVLIGGIAIVLGCFVEPLEINFMVGQAFAIAAASYFPLLFMSVWWRGMTMRGAAIGMLAGGLCALGAVTLTNLSNLAVDKGPMGKIFAGFAPMNDFWAQHPLLRILCEQPAIWTVPLAIGLMIVVSKVTRKDVPSDVRMKMLVLHAPEKLGLKQEYIQEHQHGH